MARELRCTSLAKAGSGDRISFHERHKKIPGMGWIDSQKNHAGKLKETVELEEEISCN